MDQDLKERACRLAAQLVIAEQLVERGGDGGLRGQLGLAISAAAGNAHSLAHALSVTDDEIQAAAEVLRSHKTYQVETGGR
jgi:hypothetical protein